MRPNAVLCAGPRLLLPWSTGQKRGRETAQGRRLSLARRGAASVPSAAYGPWTELSAESGVTAEHGQGLPQTKQKQSESGVAGLGSIRTGVSQQATVP